MVLKILVDKADSARWVPASARDMTTFQWICVTAPSRHQDAYSSFFRLMKRVARKERPSGRLLDANSILWTAGGSRLSHRYGRESARVSGQVRLEATVMD